MKRIALSNCDQFAIVDDADYEKLATIKWWGNKGHRTSWYAKGSIKVDGKTRIVLMHRFILEAGRWDPIDHVNNNGLDNRRSNLRFCTIAQNNMNRPVRKDSKSGLKGVTKRKGKKIRPWAARISAGGKKITLGYFESQEHAAIAYDVAAMFVFGKFAHLNANIPAPLEPTNQSEPSRDNGGER